MQNGTCTSSNAPGDFTNAFWLMGSQLLIAVLGGINSLLVTILVRKQSSVDTSVTTFENIKAPNGTTIAKLTHSAVDQQDKSSSVMSDKRTESNCANEPQDTKKVEVAEAAETCAAGTFNALTATQSTYSLLRDMFLPGQPVTMILPLELVPALAAEIIRQQKVEVTGAHATDTE